MTEEDFKILKAFAVMCNHNEDRLVSLGNGDYKAWFSFHTKDEMKNFVEVCRLNGFIPDPMVRTVFFNCD